MCGDSADLEVQEYKVVMEVDTTSDATLPIAICHHDTMARRTWHKGYIHVRAKLGRYGTLLVCVDDTKLLLLQLTKIALRR